MRTAILLLPLLLACTPPSTTATDAGAPTGPADAGATDAGGDAGVDAGADAGADAGPTCLRVTAPEIAFDRLDDVSVMYSARLSPSVRQPGPDYLSIQFLRYADTEFVGTFDLGSGNDSNLSTCAHCVMIFADQLDPSAPPGALLFVTAGTLTVAEDPFGLKLRGSLTGARFVEVTVEGETLQSVPVPGGLCVEVDDVNMDFKYVPSTWSCDPARFNEADGCDCNCGTEPDPDCFAEELPVIRGCDVGDTCVLGECVETCSAYAPTDACDVGVCTLGWPDDLCTEDPVDAATLGMPCQSEAFYCGVQLGIATGVCDVFDHLDGICRVICDSDDDCDTAAFERCFSIMGGETGFKGFCSSRVPNDWTCEGATFDDGVSCNCDCGAVDPDCEAGLPVVGCDAGETCAWTGVCVAQPANDDCASATTIAVGETVTGTTLAARHDYSPGFGSTCLAVDESGPDVVYALTLQAGQTVDITLTPAEHDLALYVLDAEAEACAAAAPQCLVGADVGRQGEPEGVTVTAAESEVLFVVVDSFWVENQGAFELTVTAQ
ncbi:MAG: hypothetical protein AB2A00_04505 [Myxococcota bacterium]